MRVMFAFRCLIPAVLAGFALPPVTAEDAAKPATVTTLYQGIVRIENAGLQPDYRTPWNGARPAGGSGTGFLIGKNRFLTNAHVVSNSTRLIIKRMDDADPHLAKIEHIAHDCDLALLSLHDEKHFEDIPAVALASDLPMLDTEVIAVGYPVGGERVSVTRGVVSRIDFRPVQPQRRRPAPHHPGRCRD